MLHELLFLHLVGYAGHVVHSGASGHVKNQRTIFHALVGPVRNPQKVCRVMLRRTCVLHPLRFAGHVVHCAASMA
jgi:hypothetical protein